MKKDEITHIKRKKEEREMGHKIQKEKHRVRIVTKKDHMNKRFFTYLYKSEIVFGFLFKFPTTN